MADGDITLKGNDNPDMSSIALVVCTTGVD